MAACILNISLYWSPVGPTNDGSVCFCIEFQKLNGVSTFDAVYPMSWANALLDVVGEVRVLITIDFTKGYWQILLAQDNFCNPLRALPLSPNALWPTQVGGIFSVSHGQSPEIYE